MSGDIVEAKGAKRFYEVTVGCRLRSLRMPGNFLKEGSTPSTAQSLDWCDRAKGLSIRL